MVGYIYCHISPSGKKYIGQTTTSLEHRFNNGENYISSPVFWKAIQKYGWNNFKHLTLHTIKADSKQELIKQLNILEREEIYKNNSLVPNGYNIELGGGQGRVTLEKAQQISRTALKNKAPSKEQLLDLYINQNLTMAEVGKRLNLNRTSVSKWIKWYNIPINYQHRNKKYISKEELKQKYINENMTQKQCAEYFHVSEKHIPNLIKKYKIYKRRSESND